MSSETDSAEFSSMLERMAQGRGDGLSRIVPLLLALAAGEEDENEESTDLPTRLGQILIDPLNGMVVMIRSASGLESFFSGQGKQGSSPASKSSVENMPRVVIGEDKENGGSCPICLEDWSKGDVAAEMPCKHSFHSKCVEEWLGNHATCPLCRYEMPVEEEQQGNKVGILIGFFTNGGERRNEEDEE